MNDLKNSKILVIGGAGLIGSHIVEELLKEEIREIIIYDNFSRGRHENIKEVLLDNRCLIFPLGGDIRDVDILDKAMEEVHFLLFILLHYGCFIAMSFLNQLLKLIFVECLMYLKVAEKIM